MTQTDFSSAYGWMMILSIVISIMIWRRLARADSRLLFIYMAALMGALFGSKVAYLAAEGLLHLHDENRWQVLATGKSITGALLGGYAGVEIVKRLTGYRKPTGDLFAIVAPFGIALGRVGCILHGCCLGQPCRAGWYGVPDAHGVFRWPAAQVELIFNLGVGLVLWQLRRLGVLKNQLFHIYLMAYGLFRFGHEFWRDTPRFGAGLSGYQFISLLVFGLGLWRFVSRQRTVAAQAPP